MSAHAARKLSAPAAPSEQLSLPEVDVRRDLPPLPEPVAARPCPGCGWYVREAEEQCPLCHVRKDSSP